MANSENMPEKLREALSAAMDGEAGQFELRRSFDEAGRDPRLLAVWERYHEVSATWRGERRFAGRGMRDRVWQALHAPPPLPKPARPWRVSFAAVSVAAGLTIAVLLGPEPADEGGEAPVGQLAEEPPLPSQFAAPEASVPLQDGTSPQDMQRMRAYMMHHVQHRALHGPGLSSFAKLVTHVADGHPE